MSSLQELLCVFAFQFCEENFLFCVLLPYFFAPNTVCFS